MRFLSLLILLAARRDRKPETVERTSPTPTRRMCGRWGSGARELPLAAQILVSVGHTTRVEASIPRVGWSRGRSQLQLA